MDLESKNQFPSFETARVLLDDKEKYAIRFNHLQVPEGQRSETAVFFKNLTYKEETKVRQYKRDTRSSEIALELPNL